MQIMEFEKVQEVAPGFTPIGAGGGNDGGGSGESGGLLSGNNLYYIIAAIALGILFLKK